MFALSIVLLAALAGAPPPVKAAAKKVLTLEKRGGHFFVDVTINGIEAGEFLVDTGASGVSIPRAVARECHVDGPFRRINLNTANGVKRGLVGKAAVGAGPFTFADIDVVVSEGGRPLLGMSFLSQLDMRVSSTTLELRPLVGGEPVDIADIEPAQIKLAQLELPEQIGDARCTYDERSDRWSCDERVHQEHDGAASIGATSGLKVGIELLRSDACLTGVRMSVAAEGKALVVPWDQSVVVANGVKQASPRASIGRADKGDELSYVLRVGDHCIDADWQSAHETSWSVGLLVDNKPARVKWLHRWTPTTATASALLESMTPPDIPPARRDEVAAPSDSFPLWTSAGGAAALVVAGASGAIGAGVASSSQLEVGLISGAVALGISAPLLVGGGYMLDSSGEQPAPPAPPADELARKKRAAYDRQLAR